MTTLSKNANRVYEGGPFNDVPAIASDVVYEGAAVGENGSGYGRPLVAGDPFRGFAVEKCDNSDGGAGAKNIKVRRFGDVVLNISGAAITDVGKEVFASDDNTFTLTESTNTCIGYVKRFVETGVVVVAFHENESGMTELTDNSTGTASDTIASISDAATKNAIASIAAKVNTLIRRNGG